MHKQHCLHAQSRIKCLNSIYTLHIPRGVRSVRASPFLRTEYYILEWLEPQKRTAGKCPQPEDIPGQYERRSSPLPRTVGDALPELLLPHLLQLLVRLQP
jgi:hypothetical protein